MNVNILDPAKDDLAEALFMNPRNEG